MQVYRIDKNGYYVKPVDLEEGEEIPSGCIIARPPNGLYRAKWTGIEWIEDMSQEEIDGLNNQPQEPSENEVLRDYILDVDYRLIMIELGI
jgi:hypothetical protein